MSCVQASPGWFEMLAEIGEDFHQKDLGKDSLFYDIFVSVLYWSVETHVMILLTGYFCSI